MQGILEHMLKKGSGRVGRVQRLEIDDAVILGMKAHIRHRWTEYDRIIKHVGKESARKRVERAVEQKFVEWGGKAWKKMEHGERRSQRLSKEEKDEMKFRYRAAQKVEKFERILEERAEKKKGSGGKKKKVKMLKDKEMARKTKLEAKRDEKEKKGEAVVRGKRKRVRAKQKAAGDGKDEMDVDDEVAEDKDVVGIPKIDKRPAHRKTRKQRREDNMARAKALREAQAIHVDEQISGRGADDKDAQPDQVNALQSLPERRKPEEVRSPRVEITIATDLSDLSDDLQEQTLEQHREAVEIAQEQKQKIDPYDQLLQLPDSKLIAWICRDGSLPEPSHILQSILDAVNDSPAQIDIKLRSLEDTSVKAFKKRRHLREQALLGIAKDMHHRRKFQTLIVDQRVKEKRQHNSSCNVQKLKRPAADEKAIVQAASLPRSGRAERCEKRGQVANALDAFSDEENSMV